MMEVSPKFRAHYDQIMEWSLRVFAKQTPETLAQLQAVVFSRAAQEAHGRDNDLSCILGVLTEIGFAAVLDAANTKEAAE